MWCVVLVGDLCGVLVCVLFVGVLFVFGVGCVVYVGGVCSGMCCFVGMMMKW